MVVEFLLHEDNQLANKKRFILLLVCGGSVDKL
jgi:hypothetical protein